MIKIFYPEGFIKEKEYILSVLFGEFLDVSYSNQVHGETDYYIVLPNNKKLIVESHFFNKKNSNYLKPEYLPRDIKFNNYGEDLEDVPVLYGNENLHRDEENITLGLDIFSSSFFMLTRWEEYISDVKDLHKRFPFSESIAYKNNFLNRPIVNEYIELLWNLLKELDSSIERKKREFSVLLSHDVDVLKFIKNPTRFVLSSLKSLLTSPSVGLFNLKKFFDRKIVGKKDIYNTFDYLMDLSESIDVKSHFFFIAGGISPRDKGYDIYDGYTKSLIQKIHNRNHIIGIHPSYMSYNNPEQFSKEVNILRDISPQPILSGRQHYLRFEVPTTWQLWEDNGLTWDSTLSYAAREGFRCGTCYEYSVFNILTREKLKLKEKPLLVMEGSLVTYQTLANEEFCDKINRIIAEVKKYNGEFTFLWHNSSFGNETWKKYDQNYEKILTNI